MLHILYTFFPSDQIVLLFIYFIINGHFAQLQHVFVKLNIWKVEKGKIYIIIKNICTVI